MSRGGLRREGYALDTVFVRGVDGEEETSKVYVARKLVLRQEYVYTESRKTNKTFSLRGRTRKKRVQETYIVVSE